MALLINDFILLCNYHLLERGSRKRPSSAGSEKIETVGGRQEKMEGHCSTGQSPQWAVVPMEEELSSLLISVTQLLISYLLFIIVHMIIGLNLL